MNQTLQHKFDIFYKEIEDSGLIAERRYGYYALYAILVIAGMVASLFVLATVSDIGLQLLNAVFLGTLVVQAGLLAHDFSHKQVFVSTRANKNWATVVWGLLVGLSESRWYEKHNAHHVHTNHVNRDPDTKIPFVFSDQQTHTSLLMRLTRSWQHIFFFIALPFTYLHNMRLTFLYMMQHINARTLAEFVFIAFHFAVLFFFVFFFHSFWFGVVFLAVHLVTIGVYMSLVFAPNHKGEVMYDGERVTYIDQIIATRNIYPSTLVFHIFGGLNYQIEHHLFSTMARINYPKVQPLVKKFCHENGVRYHETTWPGSLKEIYFSLKEMSKMSKNREVS